MLSAVRMTVAGLAVVVVSLLLPPLGPPVVIVASWMVGGTVAGLGLLAMAEHLLDLARRQKSANA